MEVVTKIATILICLTEEIEARALYEVRQLGERSERERHGPLRRALARVPALAAEGRQPSLRGDDRDEVRARAP